jgi:23S rRNA pseudouridine955/2504/2580 synthase/23S rRNA pseudouridine1911/1915/1917 synthase
VDPVIKLSAPETGGYWEIPILFEDGQLLALDKPSGLLTCPDRYDLTRPNLRQLLQRDVNRGATWVRARNLTFLANAYRLDLETSGVLLLAKDKATLMALADQFSTPKPIKYYLALVHSVPQENAFSCTAKLAPHPHKPGIVRADPQHGKQAITHFTVLERFQDHTLLRCQPVFDRTHQVRVHLKWLKFPLVADEVYHGRKLMLSSLKPNYRLKDDRSEKPLLNRTALHAECLRLVHPLSQADLTISAPSPKDFLVALKYLRKFSSPSKASETLPQTNPA